MTVADPHGAVRDTTRSCYESWMAVPDAPQPIRVRWYAVPRPAPGIYDVSDYCSSDWDESPHSLDPDVGEQSSTRQPWTDWRDCSGPPFPPPPASMVLAGFRSSTVRFLTYNFLPVNGVKGLHGSQYPAWQFFPNGPISWIDQGSVIATTWTVTPTAKGITVVMSSVVQTGFHVFMPFTLTWKGVPSQVTRPLPISDFSSWLAIIGDSSSVDGSTVTIEGYSFLQENDMFIGQTFAYAGPGALPPRCLECNGARYLQASYPELFGVIGLTYGPDNSDGTFAVPDDRDKVIYGAGLTYAVGQAVGSDSPTLTANQLPTHTHPVVVTDPGHHHPPFNPAKWLVHRNNAGGTAESGPAFSGTGPMGTDGITGDASTGITAVGGNNATTGQPLDVRQAGIARRSVIYAGR